MGIGAYRHLVTLEHPAVVTDPPTWHCALQPAGAQVGDGLAAFFIRGRYHPGITLETQITWEGRTFQVQGIADLDERHREIQITAVEVVGRGTTPGGAPVNVPPTITVGPASVTIDAGESVTLTVEASGTVPLFYQWLEDGAELPGMDDQFYVTGPLEATATYAVRVSNTYGSVLSAPASVTVPSAYQARVLDDGASAYWPLGTTAEDLVAGNHGTISGGVTLNQLGVTDDGTAMVFNGTTGKITTAAVAIPSAATIECWFNTAAGPVRAAFTDSGTTIGLGTSGGSKLYLASAAGVFYSVRPVADGFWHHAAVVLTGTTVTIYLDGVLDATGAYTRSGDSGAGTIGADASTFWSGALQDVAIYPRALTPAEILAHYALRVTVPPSPLLTNLVSYWKLDEASGTRSDAHGTNHLTPINAPGSAAGQIGTAVNLAAASVQYLSHVSNSDLQLGDRDWTIQLWAYANAGGNQSFLAKDGVSREYHLDVSTGAIRLYWVNGGVPIVSAPLYGVAQWGLILAWYDATANTLNLQINNGGVVTVSDGGNPPPTGAAEFRIGHSDAGGIPFDGKIDEVAIWHRVLTPAERTELYNAGAGKTYPFAP